MDNTSNTTLQKFNNLVGIRFQLYNSLFTALPFHKIEKTGILLSLFLIECEEGFANGLSPAEVIENFIKQNTDSVTEQDKLDILFRFIQYAERQIVLFDGLEESAFEEINDVKGQGTLKHLQSEVEQSQLQDQMAEALKDFQVRIVLTAHPTQFYPGEVLAIIHDLSDALKTADAATVNTYLRQLGKTPFLRKTKPTPYEEALGFMWFLENTFYHAAGRLVDAMKQMDLNISLRDNPVIRMGFWPGGDRDGNPFVKADTTIKVAGALKRRVLKSYFRDVTVLRRRLTFKGVEQLVVQLEDSILKALYHGDPDTITKDKLLAALEEIKESIINEHNGLFLDKVENLISKVEVFGLFFATLDIRQDSSMHVATLDAINKQHSILPENYYELGDEEKVVVLMNLKPLEGEVRLEDEIMQDTLDVIKAIRDIQAQNGTIGCDRYIISHSTSAVSIAEVYGLFLLAGWQKEEMPVDIVPLFETIDDLKHAAGVMNSLYSNDCYRHHLELRGCKQTIMLGFSDGTKDGGYLQANWSIYKAKEELTATSRDNGIDVVFFDGRGGPPARGGGRSHRFYASMGENISNKEIQITIQGQTISSNFGTIPSAKFNIEQLLHAGIINKIHNNEKVLLDKAGEQLLTELSAIGFDAYSALKNHPVFLDYLSYASPLRFYADTNIGSRPSKRGNSQKLSLSDLRAIPFVGAWSQIKQNVTGYYGVGTALKAMKEAGRWQELKDLYNQSLFFKTLINNCEMVMMKSYFPLTRYLQKHPKYGELWNMIYDEFQLTKQLVLDMTNKTELMADFPVNQHSVLMRERIVLPLTTIQQYGITRLRESEENNTPLEHKDVYEKLVMRCSFGIINAGRNSA